MLVIDLPRKTAVARQVHQPEIARAPTALRLRGRLPVDPGLLCRGRTPGHRAGHISTATASWRSIEGLMATCLQHEIDHLNGVLFIDHISKLKRDMVVKVQEARPRGQGAEASWWDREIPFASSSWSTPEFFGADAARHRRGRTRVAAVYKPPRARLDGGLGLTPSPVQREAGGWSTRRAHQYRARRGRAGRFPRPARPMSPWSSLMACCRRRFCRHPGAASRPCLAFAALAWRRAHPARDHVR